MPVVNILTRKVGNELLDWVYLGTRTGMRRGVAEYRQRTAAGDTVGADAAIRRAVDLPHRMRARVNQGIATYGLPRINAVIAATSIAVTSGEVSADLTALETYAAGLVAHRLNDAWTWDQIATDIETNISFEGNEWQFPLPPGYTDVWGG